MKPLLKKSGILPGFGLSLGCTLTWLGLIVLLPLAALAARSTESGWLNIWNTLMEPRVLASMKLTFSSSFMAAAINAVAGFILAWFLVRVPFPGKKLFDAVVDLPFAMPTAISGIALTTLFSTRGWFGRPLADMGIKVAFTQTGIVIAMVFIGLPFVVRTIQPVLQELEVEVEEVALSLGATTWQTFRRIIFPNLIPPLLTGFTLAFARALGEYGSIIFIAGNMPMKTEINALLIITKLEQYDTTGATAIGLGMLVISFVLLLLINSLQAWTGRMNKGL